MIELKKEFRKKGVDFKQVYKDDELVIYKTGFPSFEVFRPMIHNADKYHMDVYELYPYDEAFGSFAWSCSNESSVNKILKKHFPNHRLAVEGFNCSGEVA